MGSKPLATPDTQEVRPSLLRPGDVLMENYEVRCLLGEGGMGQVFEGFDRRLGRSVAIKAAFPIDGAPPLEHEARALAAFRHPAVPTVHHLGRENGLDFLVMELVQGQTLDDCIHAAASDGLPFDEGLALLQAICSALAAAHGAGLSHRDIKPANIMLAPRGRIVLMDFGLYAPDFRRPKVGPLCGSPAYMAPELIRGDLRAGGGQSLDLYALGCVAFEMFTKRPPFADGDVDMILRGHLSSSPPRLRTLRPDAPAVLDNLVDGLLAKDPSERPENAEVVLWQLQRARQALSAPPERRSPAPPPMSAPVRRPHTIVIVEDDPVARQSLAALARAASPESRILTFRDGESALVRMRRDPPDVLILDRRLPGTDGIDIATALRRGARYPDLSIIAVSADFTADDRAHLAAIGNVEVIQKGAELAKRLPELLRRLTASAREASRSGRRARA